MIKTPLALAAAAAIAAGRLVGPPVDRRAAHLTVNDAPSPLRPGYAARSRELVDPDAPALGQRRDQRALRSRWAASARPPTSMRSASRTFFRRKLSGALPLIDDPAATGRNSHPAREAAALLDRARRRPLPRPPSARHPARPRGGTSSSRAGSSRATVRPQDRRHRRGRPRRRDPDPCRRRALGPRRVHRAAQHDATDLASARSCARFGRCARLGRHAAPAGARRVTNAPHLVTQE